MRNHIHRLAQLEARSREFMHREPMTPAELEELVELVNRYFDDAGQLRPGLSPPDLETAKEIADILAKAEARVMAARRVAAAPRRGASSPGARP